MPLANITNNPITQHFLSLKLNDQREYLSNLRESDPDSARRLIESIWSQSDAVSRNAYIDTFITGLSLADEDFLESALDDRSKRVRGRAAYSLAILPGSRLLQRFIDQAVNHLDYMIHMRPNTPDKIHVTLPAAYTATMKRDGILEKPYTTGLSAPAFWLFQMLDRVPPATWTHRWHRTPQQISKAAFNTEGYKQYLITSWLNATFTYKDAGWAEAFLAYNLEEITVFRPQSVLDLVPADRREKIIENSLSPHPGLLHVSGTPIYMLWHLKQPWSPGFSTFILNRLTHYLNPTTPEDSKVRDAMYVIAGALSLSVANQAETLLNTNQPTNPYYASEIANLLQILRSRREMLEVLQQ